MPFDAVFDARTVQPKQGGAKHPVGNKFPFTITNTIVKDTKDKKGGIFEVECTSPAGSIVRNFNLWNESPQAREIAGQQLSALCHATGIFSIDFKNDGAALRGGKGLMDVNFQRGQEPSAEKPEGGYVEISKFYDVNGNEPGQAPVNQPANTSGFGQAQQNQQLNQQQQQPQIQNGGNFGSQQTQQAQGNWQQNNQQSQQQQQQPNQQQNWQQQGQQNQQAQQQTNNNGGGWQQQNNNGQNQTPPWSQNR